MKNDLRDKKCVPCEGGIPPLEDDRLKELLTRVPNWKLSENKTEIMRAYQFKNFHESMAFVNAVAWIANREHHHPDLEVGYNYVRIRYSTHAIKGLSENDFVCAAKIDALTE